MAKFRPAHPRYNRYRYARTSFSIFAPPRQWVREIEEELSKNPPKTTEKMNARQFFDKVALLRSHQREYFQTRSRESLRASIALEQEIDAEIARVRAILEAQA